MMDPTPPPLGATPPPRAQITLPVANPAENAPRRLYRRSNDRPARLDLTARREDVRRMSRSLPLFRVLVTILGWEEADLDQEIMLRLWTRQLSAKSAYDPQRAGVGRYLYVALSSILSHIRRYSERVPRGGRGGRGAVECAWPDGADFAAEVEDDQDGVE